MRRKNRKEKRTHGFFETCRLPRSTWFCPDVQMKTQSLDKLPKIKQPKSLNPGSWLRAWILWGGPRGTWVPTPKFKSCHGPWVMGQPRGGPPPQDQFGACKMGLMKLASWGSQRRGPPQGWRGQMAPMQSFLPQD